MILAYAIQIVEASLSPRYWGRHLDLDISFERRDGCVLAAVSAVNPT